MREKRVRKGKKSERYSVMKNNNRKLTEKTSTDMAAASPNKDKELLAYKKKALIR